MMTPAVHGDTSLLSSFDRLQRAVIRPGLCTHCGACVGLAQGVLRWRRAEGPLPAMAGSSPRCPNLPMRLVRARGWITRHWPCTCSAPRRQNWLIGVCRSAYLGYSLTTARFAAPRRFRRCDHADTGLPAGAGVDPGRGGGAPGAAQALAGRAGHRPNSGRRYGRPARASMPRCRSTRCWKRWRPFPAGWPMWACRTRWRSLRRLQRVGHPGAAKVDYVLGPYVGTNLYAAAIESYLRSPRYRDLEEVTELRYREGEWPGYLQVETRDWARPSHREVLLQLSHPLLRDPQHALSVDFTNELTDISVGDAWHPGWKRKGGGFSVVVARSRVGEQFCTPCRRGAGGAGGHRAGRGAGHAWPYAGFQEAGSFIRMQWRKARGLPVPDYGYAPVAYSPSRYAVELVISTFFASGGRGWPGASSSMCRSLSWVRCSIRRASGWKQLSKPVKRKGLAATRFVVRRRRRRIKGQQRVGSHVGVTAP